MAKTIRPPQVSALKCDPAIRERLQELTVRRIQIKSEADALERERKQEVDPELLELLPAAGVTRVSVEDWTVGIKPWSNSHIDSDVLKDVLLAAGVDLDVITNALQAATFRNSGNAIDAVAPRAKNAPVPAGGVHKA